DQGIQADRANLSRPAAPDPAERPESIIEPGTFPARPSDIPWSYPWARPPAPPQPGFWLGVLLTLGMFLLCQIAIPVGIVLVLLVARSLGQPDVWAVLGTKAGMKQFQSETAMLLLVSAHAPMIV